MTITAEKNGETLILRLEGRLDNDTAPELQRARDEQIEGITNLVFDMQETEYVSSAGLRVLLETQKKMNRIGSFKLTGVCEDVMEVFEMTGFAEMLTIE